MPAVNRFAISAALAVLTLFRFGRSGLGARARQLLRNGLGLRGHEGPGVGPGAAVGALMQQSGVRTVRTVFRWAAVEPVAGGPLDWSSTDPLVGYAAANKIELLPVVLGAPGWAAVGTCRLTERLPRARG